MVAKHLSAQVAVVGAGPAGVAASCRAAEAGARTVVLDEGFAPGGQIYRRLPDGPVPERFAAWLSRLARSGATVVSRAAVFDARSLGDAAGGFRLSAACRTADGGEETLVIDARRLVVATGARELFLPFPGWTLPGVVGVGGAQALLKSGFDAAGRSAVVAGSGPLLLPVAAALARAGARVRLVAEQAPWGALARFALGLLSRPDKVREAMGYRAAFAATPFYTGTWVSAAGGAGRVETATLGDGRRSFAVPCDLLAVSYGLVPSSELARLLGCRVAGREVVVEVDGAQATSVPGIFAAGEPCGIAGVDAALAEGEIAGAAAAGAFAPGSPDGRRLVAARRAARRFAAHLARTFALRPELRSLATAETVICRCEDVTRGALEPAWGARQAKLAARAGMGACQGRICGPALSFLFGWEADAIRPPLQPVALEHLLAQEESA